LKTIGEVILNGFLIMDHFKRTGFLDLGRFGIKLAYLNMGFPPPVVLNVLVSGANPFNVTMREKNGIDRIKQLQSWGIEAIEWIKIANARSIALGCSVVQLEPFMHLLPQPLRNVEVTYDDGKQGQKINSFITSTNKIDKEQTNPHQDTDSIVKSIIERTTNSIDPRLASPDHLPQIEVAQASNDSDTNSDNESYDSRNSIVQDIITNLQHSVASTDVENTISKYVTRDRNLLNNSIDKAFALRTDAPISTPKIPTAPVIPFTPLKPVIDPSPAAIAVAGSVRTTPYTPTSHRKKAARRAFIRFRKGYTTRANPSGGPIQSVESSDHQDSKFSKSKVLDKELNDDLSDSDESQ
jgi:hypothetical protein